MSDRQQIVDLTVEYCYALDEKRFDDLTTVFTPDARVDYGTIVCDGVDAVIDFVRSIVAPLDATTHMVTNHRVVIDGDTATSSCYLLSQHVLAGSPGGDLYAIAGRYDDELVRTPNGWRIASRRLTRSWKDGNPHVVRRD